MIDRAHRELTSQDITRIATTYHAWRGDENTVNYVDVPGFCKSTTLEEIRTQGYILTPGRYVGIEDVEDDDIPFERQMKFLSAKLHEQIAESERLDTTIKKNLEVLGYRGK